MVLVEALLSIFQIWVKQRKNREGVSSNLQRVKQGINFFLGVTQISVASKSNRLEGFQCERFSFFLRKHLTNACESGIVRCTENLLKLCHNQVFPQLWLSSITEFAPVVVIVDHWNDSNIGNNVFVVKPKIPKQLNCVLYRLFYCRPLLFDAENAFLFKCFNL